MEGFLRSSFLLRLVSFLLLPFRITGWANGDGSGLTGVKFSDTFRLCPITCVSVCEWVHLINVKHGFWHIYPSCVLWLCPWLACSPHWQTVRLKAHINNLRDTCRLAVPFFFLFLPLFKEDQAFCALPSMLLSDHSPPLCLLTNHPKQGCWVRQLLSCDVCCFLLFSVCTQPTTKIYIFCLYPSCDSN